MTYYRWSIFDMERFWHSFELTSCKLSLFLFLIPLHISQTYCVFINKVLQRFIRWQNTSTDTLKVRKVVFNVLLWFFVGGQTCFLVHLLTNDSRLIQWVHYLNIHLRLGLITFVSFLYSGLDVQRLQLDPFTFLVALC